MLIITNILYLLHSFFLTLSKGLGVLRSLIHLNIVALRKTQDTRTAEDEKEWEPEVKSGCMILYLLISYLSKTWKLTDSIYYYFFFISVKKQMIIA